MAKAKKGGKPRRPLNILYIDGMIAAVEKPAGLPVQGGEGVGASLEAVLSEQLGQKVYPVHRLDKDTAGALVVALSKAAASLYSEYFRQKRIAKGYRAICLGRPPESSGQIDAPLQRRVGNSGRLVMQSAETLYAVEAASADGEFSLLSVRIETGRMHQIRRHFALAGFPVACDEKYGDFKRNREIKRLFGAKRLQLAATSIALPRLSVAGGSAGADKEEPLLEISCPLPAHMNELMGKVFGIRK